MCDTLEAHFARLRQFFIQLSASLGVLLDSCLTRSILVSRAGGSAPLRALVEPCRAESDYVSPSRVTLDSRLVQTASSRRHRLPNIEAYFAGQSRSTGSLPTGLIQLSASLRVLLDPCLTQSILVSCAGVSAPLRVLVDTCRAESVHVSPSRVTLDSRLVSSASSRRHSLPNIKLSDFEIDLPKQKCGDLVQYFSS